MNTGFSDYFRWLPVSTTATVRLTTVIEECQTFCPEPFSDIFLCDFIKGDGSREFSNLWLFTPKYLVEAKQFLSKDDFDITPYNGRITYLCFKKSDYDFVTATEKSRMHLHILIGPQAGGELTASHANCERLLQIAKKIFIPNLQDPQSSTTPRSP